MSWNRNDPLKTPKTGKKPSALRGIAAGAAVVALAVIAYFLFFSGENAPKTKVEKKGGMIKEVKPSAAPTNTAEKAAEPKERPPQRVGEIRDGYIMLCHGKLHKIKGIVTNYSGVAKLDYEIFDHMSENIIAGLLTIKPGQMLVGTPRYNGHVQRDFLESLKEPIVIKADDSEYDKELKRAVRDAKIELKAAYDRGENIEDILLRSREEMQKLGRYKQELKTMTIQGLSNAATAEEMDDYIQAANKMLEAKGIQPMDLSPIAKIKLRMKENKKERMK